MYAVRARGHGGGDVRAELRSGRERGAGARGVSRLPSRLDGPEGHRGGRGDLPVLQRAVLVEAAGQSAEPMCNAPRLKSPRAVSLSLRMWSERLCYRPWPTAILCGD
eukprot:6295946-Prymnesium_polylepis.1